MDADENKSGLEDYVANARARLTRANSLNEELVAIFDGVTGCLSALVGELALIRRELEKRDA